MSADDRMFDDIVERELFLELIADGIPQELAGYEVGWSPARVRLNLEDSDFALLVEAAKTRDLDELEKVLRDMAKDRHFGALQMILFNKRPNQWRDIKRIEMRSEIEAGPGLVSAVKGVIFAAMRAHGPAALQPGGALDQEILDGEVVGGDE